MDPNRRDFLRMAAALGLGPALGPFGLRLAAMGASAAAPAGDYKALVCLFLLGGLDAAGTVLATDPDSWGRYQAARGVPPWPIALAAPGAAAVPGALGTLGAAALGGVLPISPRTAQPWPDGTTGTGARTFALHPLMPKLQRLFAQGHAAVVANVGTLVQPISRQQYLDGTVPVPKNLFSHADQQATWQTGERSKGWGGLLGDRVAAGNPYSSFTAISMTGNSLFLAGDTVSGYQATSHGAVQVAATAGASLFGSTKAPSLLTGLITRASGTSPLETGHAEMVARSLASESRLNGAMRALAPAAPDTIDPVWGSRIGNPFAQGLQSIANLIGAGRTLGMKRQIFMLAVGSCDFHSDFNAGQHRFTAYLDDALGYFYRTLGALDGQDLTSQVTTFTLSEFGRCLVSNGSGVDHGWGGHHFVVGGAVKGGDIYGTYPTVGVDLKGFVNPGALPGTGAWIPTLPVEQYASCLGAWMGLDPSQLLDIFPNLGHFQAPGDPGLGFL